MKPAVTIVAASWSKDQECLRRIRYDVFVIEQKVAAREEWDGADAECHHALALTADGQVIGTGRLQASGKIGRVAVLAPWRKQGIGRRLMQYFVDVAIRERMSRVYLHARAPNARCS